MFHVPDWLAERNLRSWADLVSFYDRLIECPGYEFTAPLRRLAQSVASSELARAFRAGRSLYTTMVSTAARHGLSSEDPFVLVALQQQGREVYLADYPGGGKDPVQTHTCAEGEALEVLTFLLTRLANDPNGQPARQRA